MNPTRRTMIAMSAAVAAGAESGLKSRVCLFTDHLAGFTYEEVGRMLKDLGVSGPDLTVRRGGLVAPEKVASDLPKAVETFRKFGLSVPMITTTITSADDPLAKAVAETASPQGIRYYKLGYFPYKDFTRWRESIDVTRASLQQLAKMNARLNLRAGMHNHAGDSVGCSLWDSWEAMQGVDADRVGFYFDPAQATIEGGKSGWQLNFHRIKPRLFMAALKDFVWEKSEKGWRTRWVPLGEGMVDWARVFPLIRETPFAGPISLHIEYDPGGKTKSERYDRSLAAAARDLRFLNQYLGA